MKDLSTQLTLTATREVNKMLTGDNAKSTRLLLFYKFDKMCIIDLILYYKLDQMVIKCSQYIYIQNLCIM